MCLAFSLLPLKAQDNLRTKGNMWFDLVHCHVFCVRLKTVMTAKTKQGNKL